MPSLAPPIDQARWNAVQSRSTVADGRFVYAVKTTGVYCRPSCPSRRAHRRNVAFYDSPAAARAAGFRACKRCKPDGVSPATETQAAVAAACRLIERAEAPPSLADLAATAGLSRHHFHRLFKAATGLTPRAYGAAHRAQQIRNGLQKSATVTGAIYDAGYSSGSRFYETAAGVLGMTPKSYRAGGEGMTIRFAIADSTLGKVLVAATDKGLCALFLDNDARVLRRELAARFPKAEIAAGDAAFAKTVARVVEIVEQPRRGTKLPLDVLGTAFQQRVWEGLRRIPAGETISYAELARRIGAPKAVRAVGTACGANPVSVIIPCHRVVATDGKLTGYRWGVERKRELLTREGVLKRTVSAKR